ncbi:MAG: redoxin domain-containing protein [Pedobacter sp.]|nr:redoxin domain-containing protein [Pedobacter sp.]MDQ8052102.1 redoxin domain-containing protein [Pedobacter sp.]
MKYLLTACFLIFGLTLKAQVKLLTLHELEQRVTKGKDTTYVINFWATWCSPCVKEIPNFEKLQEAYSKKPLKVILISLDFKSKLKSVVIPFVNKHHIRSEVFLVNEPDQQVFIDRVNKQWSGAIPATLIWNTGKNVRLFYEKAFSYQELEHLVDN